MKNIVVVGSGHAGVEFTDALLRNGWTGGIVLISDESELPYQRPPLSKDFLGESEDAQCLPLRAERFFVENGVQLLSGVTVEVIDREAHMVKTNDGRLIPYSTLVLATGAQNRELPIPGLDFGAVHTLRTADDARALRRELDGCSSAVVVGAGFIGLEFAAAAHKRNLDVTVLEYAPRPMGRAVTPQLSEFATQWHRGHGINLRLAEGITEILGENGRVIGARGTSGTTFPADLVLIGAGVSPRTSLAESAGLEIDNGIVVDEFLATGDPRIYAIGDCANFPNQSFGARTRLESVQNATDQARRLAAYLTEVTQEPYRELPWFWSTQGDLKIQIVGLIQPDDNLIVIGDPHSAKFSALCFREGRLRAVESVNSPADHMAARKIIGNELPLSPTEASAEGFSLKTHAQALASR